jgi:hypothetical protein
MRTYQRLLTFIAALLVALAVGLWSMPSTRAAAGGLVFADVLDQGGVRSWTAASKPTTRPDSTALVFGDRYYDTVLRMWWFWTDLATDAWVSDQVFTAMAKLQNAIVPGAADGAQECPGVPMVNYDIFVLDLVGHTFTYGNNDADHHFLVQAGVVSAPGPTWAPAGTGFYTHTGSPGLSYVRHQVTENVFFDTSAASAISMGVCYTRTGTLSGEAGNMGFTYRLVQR